MQLNNQIEQDATISEELEELNTSGTKLIKDMTIVPIENSLLYIEPVYQVMLNESEIPVLKKVIVASGNTVTIGDDLNSALSNFFNDEYAVDLEIVNTDNIYELIDSVIKANNNLKQSVSSSDFEMIGKDISSLQTLINQLETARNNQLEEEEEANNESSGLFGDDENTVENILDENILQNNANISNSLVNNY